TALRILDAVEYVHDILLPKLQAQSTISRLPESVLLHPVCSAMKLGFADKLYTIAEACAEQATTPIHASCCGFAGDRGMIVPELTLNATLLEAREAQECQYDGYYSSNPPCQTAMTTAVGKQYQSFILLVEKATRPHRALWNKAKSKISFMLS
ncbi:MAG: hypothetical protein RML40_04240, partial [Bacteroidota bacterium]|nr:hypothetical protein [Candidatus Kapabacteria bacterium]MDW8219722.1 hypothetical protein [Bacteroidota bacterium]